MKTKTENYTCAFCGRTGTATSMAKNDYDTWRALPSEWMLLHVHGGVYFDIGETVCSVSCARALDEKERRATEEAHKDHARRKKAGKLSDMEKLGESMAPFLDAAWEGFCGTYEKAKGGAVEECRPFESKLAFNLVKAGEK